MPRSRPPDADDLQDATSGFNVLPTMPASVVKVLRQLATPEWTIEEVTPKLATLAAALGIDWDVDDPTATIEMHEVYVATADSIARNRLDNPIFAHVDAGYRNWLSPRSAGQQAFTGHFGKVLDGQEFSPRQHLDVPPRLLSPVRPAVEHPAIHIDELGVGLLAGAVEVQSLEGSRKVDRNP